MIFASSSWQYFNWKLEYDTERTHSDINWNDLHILKGMSKLGESRLQWVGKIPPKGLIELRKTGAIDEIRDVLSNDISDLVHSDSTNYTKTSHKVFNNISGALVKHQENIKKLKQKKWKIAGQDFGSWLAIGTIEISSACLGTPIYGISSVVLNQIVDSPKLKDLKKSVDKIKDVEQEKKDLTKSPIGIMFKYEK